MILKGKVSIVDNINKKARILLEDRDNAVTPEIPFASNIGALEVNDWVAVAFFSAGLEDGLVIGRWPS